MVRLSVLCTLADRMSAIRFADAAHKVRRLN
jgi:hypothetical protein